MYEGITKQTIKLTRKKCINVYYAHCTIHMLQLALVTSYWEVEFIHNIFTSLTTFF